MCFQKNNMGQNTANSLIEIFTVCQRTTAVHQRNSIILNQLYENANHEEFWSTLKTIITILLRTERGNQYIEKTIKFLGTFCSLLKPFINEDNDDSIIYEEHQLLKNIIYFLLEATKLIEDTIRIRACQIINTILDNLIGTEISLQLCEDLENVLLTRLQPLEPNLFLTENQKKLLTSSNFDDPKTVVRQQAIITLHRLQDPENPEDVIIPEFIRLMNCDCFPKVRQFCIEKVAARSDVIQHILKRIQDTDQNVRLAAFTRLSKFAGFLKISEKHLVLHCGFLDKSENIREYMSVLIKTWLEFYDNDILKLMKSIRLDADERDIENTVELFENVLKIIYQKVNISDLTGTLTLNEKKLVPHDELNWEVVSFWRIYVQFLNEKNDLEEELEKVIPELIYFCKYIKEFYVEMPKEVTTDEFLEQQFIIQQLFLITKTYDFGDVTNRKCLNALVSNILENIVLTSDTIETVVSNLEYSIPDILQRTQYVSEIISEIVYPMATEEAQEKQQEQEYQISRITVEINKLKDQQEEAVRQEKFVEAERLKHELTELNANLEKLKNCNTEQPRQIQKRIDPLTTVKCLDIAAAVLLSPKVDQLTPPLQTLKEDFINELLIHENDSIRAKAFRCYGLYCVVDKATSSSGIHIFYTPIFGYKNGEECDTQILLICISAVVDILRIYGSQLMAAPENEELSESMEEQQQAIFAGGTSLTDILQGLVDLMDDDQYHIQERAGLGLCQLVLSNRIVSPSLISRLILKWCNPASDNECVRLKQIIGFTLERVPLLNNCSDQLIDAVIMTIKALYAAPRISPLADVNIESISKFLLALCKISPDVNYIHSTLAIKLLKEMVEKPKSRINPMFSKMLILIDIPNKQTSVEEVLNYCNNLLENILDKTVLNNINKLVTKINTIESNQTNIKKENSNTKDIIVEENENGELHTITNLSKMSNETIDMTRVKEEPIDVTKITDTIIEESEVMEIEDEL